MRTKPRRRGATRKVARVFAACVARVVILLSCLAAMDAAAAQQPQPRQLTEDFRLHADFKSKFLPKPRQLIVYLPPGYKTDEQKRYPVFYLLDGPNVFVLWRIDETARALMEAGQIEPLIIVGVPHGGTQQDRTDEYTPTRIFGQGGGKGDELGRMLVEEVKPFIDSQYRTLPDASHTALGGTSFGGLVSLHIGLRHPNAFGKLAVMSPSVWWDRGVILRSVKSVKAKPALRIWLDVGTEEGRGPTDAVKRLRDALTEKGWALDSDLTHFEDKGAGHNDEAWAKRAGKVLKFLFPPRAVPAAPPAATETPRPPAFR